MPTLNDPTTADGERTPPARSAAAAPTPTIDPERLAKVTTLDQGAHNSPDDGMCILEAVAYITGGLFSDHPSCVCPVISAFLRSWNDALPTDERNALLLPLIPRLVGTRGSKALETRRSYMAVDWYIRTYTPAWLRLAGLNTQADTIAALPEIAGFAQIPSIYGPLKVVRADASAAGSAARSAAWNAAESAAESALNDTSIQLQQSALTLVERMIAANDNDATRSEAA